MSQLITTAPPPVRVIDTRPAPRNTSDRLDAVDALRAIAILWVVLFHFAVFWTPSGKGDALLPYGDLLLDLPMAHIGFFGVHLFFIVSGFVISYSLTRSRSAGHFAYLRAVRLWPTLLLCGTITFVLTSLLGPGALQRSVWEYLISLTFVPPVNAGRVVGLEGLKWLDGAYWSLWVEVRFYVIAAAIFFLARRHFLTVWSLFTAACACVFLMGTFGGGIWDAASRALFAEYHPYFSAGIALAFLRRGQFVTLATALLLASIGQAYLYVWLTFADVSAGWLGLTIVFALALPTMLRAQGVPGFSPRWLVVIGQASYAYYLLHQNAGLALLTALFPGGGWLSVFGMILIQALFLHISIMLTTYLEGPLRQMLRRRAVGYSTA